MVREKYQNPNWFRDCTFDLAPVGHQLYTVQALVSETVTISLILCIAKDKTESTDKKIFPTLKEHNPTLQPGTIKVDFERTAPNAFKQNF